MLSERGELKQSHVILLTALQAIVKYLQSIVRNM